MVYNGIFHQNGWWLGVPLALGNPHIWVLVLLSNIRAREFAPSAFDLIWSHAAAQVCLGNVGPHVWKEATLRRTVSLSMESEIFPHILTENWRNCLESQSATKNGALESHPARLRNKNTSGQVPASQKIGSMKSWSIFVRPREIVIFCWFAGDFSLEKEKETKGLASTHPKVGDEVYQLWHFMAFSFSSTQQSLNDFQPSRIPRPWFNLSRLVAAGIAVQTVSWIGKWWETSGFGIWIFPEIGVHPLKYDFPL